MSRARRRSSGRSDRRGASGYDVLDAATGEEALELAYSRMPDLILLDLSLPGIGGWEVAAQLKADPRLRHVPIAALTAHALKNEERRACRARRFYRQTLRAS